MKLSELILRVDKSENNTSWADPSTLCDILDIDFPLVGEDEFESRVKKYWIHPWYCTDTWVGLSVYYFDDKPLALSLQTARKSHEDIDFVSPQMAESFYSFVVSLQKFDPSCVSFANLESEMGSGSMVSYAAELLTNCVYYNGEEAEVVKRYGLRYEGDHTMWGKVDIKRQSGEVLTVDLKDVTIPYRVK